MTSLAKSYCNLAIADIRAGNFEEARDWLRYALRLTSNRRAWSKLMLAIRELSRITPSTAS